MARCATIATQQIATSSLPLQAQCSSFALRLPSTYLKTFRALLDYFDSIIHDSGVPDMDTCTHSKIEIKPPTPKRSQANHNYECCRNNLKVPRTLPRHHLTELMRHQGLPLAISFPHKHAAPADLDLQVEALLDSQAQT